MLPDLTGLRQSIDTNTASQRELQLLISRLIKSVEQLTEVIKQQNR